MLSSQNRLATEHSSDNPYEAPRTVCQPRLASEKGDLAVIGFYLSVFGFGGVLLLFVPMLEVFLVGGFLSVLSPPGMVLSIRGLRSERRILAKAGVALGITGTVYFIGWLDALVTLSHMH